MYLACGKNVNFFLIEKKRTKKNATLKILPPVVIERCLGVDTTKDNVCFRSKVRWKIKKIKEEVKLRDTASSGQKDRKQTI
jgi:hypothetical protein